LDLVLVSLVAQGHILLVIQHPFVVSVLLEHILELVPLHASQVLLDIMLLVVVQHGILFVQLELIL
jgi:hypothetical protein